MKKELIKKSQLIWDDWNISHIKKHDVVQSEVEEVITRQIIVKSSYEGRIIIYGVTKAERTLAIVLEKEEKGYYILTARSASRRERRKL